MLLSCLCTICDQQLVETTHLGHNTEHLNGPLVSKFMVWDSTSKHCGNFKDQKLLLSTIPTIVLRKKIPELPTHKKPISVVGEPYFSNFQ